MRKLVILLVIFVALQLVPVDRSNPPVTADFDGPTQIKEIFKTSAMIATLTKPSMNGIIKLHLLRG